MEAVKLIILRISHELLLLTLSPRWLALDLVLILSLLSIQVWLELV